MNRPRNPTYLRRRQERLLAEEAQRQHARQARDYHAQMVQMAQRATDHLLNSIAAADAVAMGQFHRH